MPNGAMCCGSAAWHSRCVRWRRYIRPGAPPAPSRPRRCAMTDGNGAVLTARGVWRSFREGATTLEVLTGVELEVARGERLAIIGASGSGKTTLLQILGGLDQPNAGVVEVAGRDIHALSESERSALRNRTIGFVYQFHHLLPDFSALENVAMPLLVRRERTTTAAGSASDVLTRARLAARLNHRPHQLSGGERQRTAVARALVTSPALVLAHGPTGSLHGG